MLISLVLVTRPVIFPVFFSLYTNDLRGLNSGRMAVKFADDTALVDTSTSPTQFEEETKKPYLWCEEHFLDINVRMMKELLIDFLRKADPVPQTTLNRDAVERVNSNKYLGTIINSGLTFNDNT